MIDKNYAPVCGIYCGNCDFLGEQCKGCGYVDGKPFWTTQIPSGVCPIHDCCRNQIFKNVVGSRIQHFRFLS